MNITRLLFLFFCKNKKDTIVHMLAFVHNCTCHGNNPDK